MLVSEGNLMKVIFVSGFTTFNSNIPKSVMGSTYNMKSLQDKWIERKIFSNLEIADVEDVALSSNKNKKLNGIGFRQKN
jgi:hypothetical protein